MKGSERPTRPLPSRWLFVATILTGSVLLFLVQPMVARMALPRLGGAPNVWNSAMLVYQMLLLGGYGYAHWLGRWPVRRQAVVHLALLAIAALSLPIGLVALPPPAPGWEALWVPLLLGLSIGPVFLLVSAQAPLMQSWYAADSAAASPWALYAASNIGSFAGLIAYPLLVEPLIGARGQSWGWSAGYAVLIVLVAMAARSRWTAAPAALAGGEQVKPAVPRGQIALWLALSAVPSGLMLSTTTYLTTDIFAMPLLWVIPLGLYLLSFVVAFADNRAAAKLITTVAPAVLLVGGSLAMISQKNSAAQYLFIAVALLFVLCVALHSRLYDLKPAPARLTYFYLVMSVGGALGGLFTALIAPLIFNWSWEHPLLVLAAALLVPLDRVRELLAVKLSPRAMRIAEVGLLLLALLLTMYLALLTVQSGTGWTQRLLATAIAAIGLLLARRRALLVGVLSVMVMAQGGIATVASIIESPPTRSYFGIYMVRDQLGGQVRELMHGTTLHGRQSRAAGTLRQPTTYYGRQSGAGLVLDNAAALFGPHASVGIVGVGTGTLACYKQPGQDWKFFEIDPAVLAYSRDRTFTFMADCAPDAPVIVGDARLQLAALPRASFDVLALDAFSSDAIPLHLLTNEAFGIYLERLRPNGVLLVHISNRFFDLRPVVSALARHRGLHAAARSNKPPPGSLETQSMWIALSRDPRLAEKLIATSGPKRWRVLEPSEAQLWTDDYASILPYLI